MVIFHSYVSLPEGRLTGWSSLARFFVRNPWFVRNSDGDLPSVFGWCEKRMGHASPDFLNTEQLSDTQWLGPPTFQSIQPHKTIKKTHPLIQASMHWVKHPHRILFFAGRCRGYKVQDLVKWKICRTNPCLNQCFSLRLSFRDQSIDEALI